MSLSQNLLQQFHKVHTAPINRMAWSPNGEMLATSSNDGTVAILMSRASNHKLATLVGHKSRVHSIVWHPNGLFLFSASDDHTIVGWNVALQAKVTRIGLRERVLGLCWHGQDELVAVLETRSPSGVSAYWGQLSFNGQQLSVYRIDHGSEEAANLQFLSGAHTTSEEETCRLIAAVRGRHRDDKARITSAVLIGENGLSAAIGLDSGQIVIGDANQVRVFEGHTGKVTSLSASGDSRFLASKSTDGSVRVWSLQDGTPRLNIPEPMGSGWLRASVAFNPRLGLLATQGRAMGDLRLWNVDTVPVQTPRAASTKIHVSAKIALVGDSAAGKSCLALRLLEDRYEEQGTTHGMRVWKLPFSSFQREGEQLLGNEVRTLTLWDMGGQDEYRLVHQLFLHDTTVALVLFDPTRGRSAFEAVEGWNKGLEKQLAGKESVKILVGTKMDKPSDLVDVGAVNRLLQSCSFATYIETSAKTGRGISELKEVLARSIDWGALTRTSRPDLFERISADIDRRATAGEAVLLHDDLEADMSERLKSRWDRGALDSVVKQLAMQGAIAETRLATGERAMVLRVSEIERYAGSLIVAARNNPRHVPSLEAATIVSPSMGFPGLTPDSRLSPIHERIVLECVVQLLLTHGICFRHQGLLIFPSLFAEHASSDDKNLGALIYYNFSGAIDNIYSSLVAKLASVDTFGPVRISKGKAHFEKAGQGTCGIHNITTREGFAQLDLYFSDDCTESVRDLFTVFVEEHLRTEGVEIAEELAVACPRGTRLEPKLLRDRVLIGKPYIICPACEVKHVIRSGAQQTRAENREVEKHLLALKTRIQRGSQSAISLTQVSWRDQAKRLTGQPIRILHLSDLHFRSDSDPRSVFEPLRADLQDQKDGMGLTYLDYLIVSGDLVQTGAPVEFEKALQFVSSIVAAFSLTATRCVVVPGNHDLTWLMPYTYRRRRVTDPNGLAEGTYSIQGDVIAIRDEKRYAERFKAFSDYFYHPFYQEEYPNDPLQQAHAHVFEDGAIQVVSLNSCAEIDELHPDRALIPEGMIERVLGKAREQCRPLGRDDKASLTLAVWHHPVAGPDSIKDTAFLDRLRQSGVRICMNGHVHEERSALLYHLHTRKIHVIGAGSFGAPVADRPESTPRLYNVLEIDRSFSVVTVHTRGLRRAGGAWEGYAVWPGKSPFEKRSFYQIDLSAPIEIPEESTDAESGKRGFYSRLFGR